MDLKTLFPFYLATGAAAAAAVYDAYNDNGGQFYPTVVAIYHSSLHMAAMYAFVGGTIIFSFATLIYLFFGKIRPYELTSLWKELVFGLTETLLAMTVFRREISQLSAFLFAILFGFKVFLWILKLRIEFLQQAPNISWKFHSSIISAILLLFSVGTGYSFFSISDLALNGVSIQLFFAFEYVILTVHVLSSFFRYILLVIDRQQDNLWEHRPMYTAVLDLVSDFIRLILYTVFFILLTNYYTLPIYIIRDVFVAFSEFVRRLHTFIQARRVLRHLDHAFPDGTPEELAENPTCSICQDDMESGKKLPCGHVFHRLCLRLWLPKKASCPTCNADIARLINNNNPGQNADQLRAQRQQQHQHQHQHQEQHQQHHQANNESEARFRELVQKELLKKQKSLEEALKKVQNSPKKVTNLSTGNVVPHTHDDNDDDDDEEEEEVNQNPPSVTTTSTTVSSQPAVAPTLHSSLPSQATLPPPLAQTAPLVMPPSNLSAPAWVQPPIQPPPPIQPILHPPPMPPVFVPINFANAERPHLDNFSVDELKALEGDEKEKLIERINYLRQLQHSIDSVVAQFGQFQRYFEAQERLKQQGVDPAVVSTATTKLNKEAEDNTDTNNTSSSDVNNSVLCNETNMSSMSSSMVQDAATPFSANSSSILDDASFFEANDESLVEESTSQPLSPSREEIRRLRIRSLTQSSENEN